ncbi:MAG: methyltransferase [Oscillospiraceae bacterium]|nr:methyltransferase [Oscillospiraceae bacterium]
MEQLHNGFTLQLCEGAFPLSTDSIALSGFVRLPKQAKVLDLGAGCGTLGLLLCAGDANCAVTGVEIDEKTHQTALENIAANKLADRLTSICADIRAVPSFLSPGSFHCCVSNPPYFSARQESANSSARHETLCALEDLFAAAAWAVRYGGDFYLVHKPDRLSELCVCATKHKLEPKRLLLLRHRPGDPISLVLLQCRKGAKPGLIIEEECLQDAQGAPTEYYRRLYHI